MKDDQSTTAARRRANITGERQSFMLDSFVTSPAPFTIDGESVPYWDAISALNLRINDERDDERDDAMAEMDEMLSEEVRTVSVYGDSLEPEEMQWGFSIYTRSPGFW